MEVGKRKIDESYSLSDQEINDLVKERLEYKKQKNYSESDRIRDYLFNNYIVLTDIKGTTAWKRLPIPQLHIPEFGESFHRDYAFYEENSEKFNFNGSDPETFEEDLEKGYDAKTCFYFYETRGIKLSCKEVKKVQEVITTKGSINLHFKMWKEGFEDMRESPEYYLKSFVGKIPDWVKNNIDKFPVN